MESYNYLEACANGEKFYRIEDRYPGKRYTSISCDRCRRGNLTEYTGILGQEIDLCSGCVDQIKRDPTNRAAIQRIKASSSVSTYQTQMPYASTFLTSPPNYIPHPRPAPYATVRVTIGVQQPPYAVIFFPH
uniref:Uncharacterized protein n=1 Tax=viral metagenome TaxID=1070528 RepID=A0A6C0C5Y9_9ZZZZ